jgi:chromosome segregation ATPase
MKKFRQWVWKKYFASEQKLIDILIRDNKELEGIAMEQIKHIQELEDKIHTLEFEQEDLELHVERLEDKVSDLEYDLERTQDENQSLEWENDRLEDQVADLQFELQNKEEF